MELLYVFSLDRMIEELNWTIRELNQRRNYTIICVGKLDCLFPWTRHVLKPETKPPSGFSTCQFRLALRQSRSRE